jgi:transcriptional regulator with XRE-family HTH domain
MARPSSRNPETDPAAFLGDELKRLRLAAGFPTQDAQARRTGYRRETITRSESGSAPPDDTLLTDLLDACEATDQIRGILSRAAILARRAQGPVPRFFEWWVEMEKKADFIRIWQPLLIPGLLQIPEYAVALFTVGGADMEQAAGKLAVRLIRQEILDGEDAVTLVVVLDEAVLYRLVGSAEIMVKQLTHLVTMSSRPNVIIEVVRGAGAYAGLGGGFQLASGSEIAETLLILAVEDQATDNQVLARKAIGLYEQIRGRALDVRDSRTAIKEAIQQWKRHRSAWDGASPRIATTVSTA